MSTHHRSVLLAPIACNHLPKPTMVIKRNKQHQPFILAKIEQAVYKCLYYGLNKNQAISKELSQDISKRVYNIVSKIGLDDITVEQIQDYVIQQLWAVGEFAAAEAYTIYREQHRRERELKKKILNGHTTKLPLAINGLKIIAKRYLQRDDYDLPIESPEAMYDRVAQALAQVEENYNGDVAYWHQVFYETLCSFDFTPAGRTLANAGAKTPVIANCVVLHFDDNLDSIFETLKEASLLQQAGSGLGFPFHLLRPAGLPTKRTQGKASGPVSFLQVYNAAFGIIQQQNRHGANMAALRVNHPDILDFIHCKEKDGSLVNFNISVALTDAFMQAVVDNKPEPWLCQWQGQSYLPRRITRDQRGVVKEIVEQKLTAKELFEEIVTAAWQNGEPGVMFIDTVNKFNPIPGLGTLETSNPCGEQYIHNGDNCNLGSINLANFTTTDNKDLDKNRLRQVTRIAIRMLDNVIDLFDFPVERVQTAAKNNRRIGLGVMGFADLLYKLKIGYNSPAGLAMAETVMTIIADESYKTSQELAEERGVFPNWKLSIFADQDVKLRNAALRTVAPTGTISMMFDCASGIEPFFALAYTKGNIIDGTMELQYVNKYLEQELRQRGLYTPTIIQKIISKGSLQQIDGIPNDMKQVYVTAMDLTPADHIQMQAVFQKYVDNSISKTCNFPNSATKNEVMQGYVLGWQLGCKGLTVYRDGSRNVQVLSLNKEQDELCPECQAKLVCEQKCKTCKECGWAVCIS